MTVWLRIEQPSRRPSVVTCVAPVFGGQHPKTAGAFPVQPLRVRLQVGLGRGQVVP